MRTGAEVGTGVRCRHKTGPVKIENFNVGEGGAVEFFRRAVVNFNEESGNVRRMQQLTLDDRGTPCARCAERIMDPEAESAVGCLCG